jgi:Fe-S oxidoreductase
MRVGLFIPCYIDAFFPEVGIATLQLLERLAIDVVSRRPAGAGAANSANKKTVKAYAAGA